MDAETKAALEASIRHWEDNVANWQGFMQKILIGEITKTDLPIFKEHCALCKLFYDSYCNGCPLNNVGHGCNQTDSPWSTVMLSLSFLDADGLDTLEASHNAARKMLQTLKDINHD